MYSYSKITGLILVSVLHLLRKAEGTCEWLYYNEYYIKINYSTIIWSVYIFLFFIHVIIDLIMSFVFNIEPFGALYWGH